MRLKLFPSSRFGFALLALTVTSPAFGWGELGHAVIAQVAAKLVGTATPDGDAERAGREALQYAFRNRWIQEGHVANIPDTLWRNLPGPEGEDANLLGAPTHYFDQDGIPETGPSAGVPGEPVPLVYEEAKSLYEKKKPDLFFFKAVGSNPWRAQQLTDLYAWTLDNYPKGDCKTLDGLVNHPTRNALAYAGLLAHFTGDSSQPYHSTADFDGEATGQNGIHWYFENDLVNGIESGLAAKVLARAQTLFTAPATVPGSVAALEASAKKRYPDDRNRPVVRLVLAEIDDSYTHLDELRRLDKTYAVIPRAEAAKLSRCDGKPVCRRLPEDLVDAHGKPLTKTRRGKSVAQWHEPLLVERLAIASALTAEIWTRTWVKSKRPTLCYTLQYAVKPAFISPTDETCFGYARKEDPARFLRKDGQTALGKKTAAGPENCISF